MVKSVTNNKDKGRTHDQMLLFGHGDGGGGPTPDMLQRLDRLSNIPGLPRVIRSTPQQFFNELEKSSGNLCEWWGELYFELHRGTYTTHAHLKKMNRVCEFMMMHLEFLAAAGKRVAESAKGIEKLWKIVLFNQFHDILPGSSIEKVFQDAKEDYSRFVSLYQDMWGKLESTSITIKSYVVNPFNWPRKGLVEVGSDKLLVPLSVPALYIGPLTTYTPLDQVSVTELRDGVSMSNMHLRCEFGSDGTMRSLRHVSSGREVLGQGQAGNRFVVFDDVPLFWDAWDVMEYHTETRQEFKPTKMQASVLHAAIKYMFYSS